MNAIITSNDRYAAACELGSQVIKNRESRTLYQAARATLSKARKNGTYDDAKAYELMLNVAVTAAKCYAEKYCSCSEDYQKVFPLSICQEVAISMVNTHEK